MTDAAKIAESEPHLPKCSADRDGDCYAAECPQKTDYQSYCPYAKAWEAYWEQFEC